MVNRRILCPDLKEVLEVPVQPRRIASIAPSITETLIEMGLDSVLTGVSTWCRVLAAYGYSEVSSKALVSDYTSISIDALRLQEIDLVLLSSGHQLALTDELRRYGIPFYVVRLPTGLDFVEVPIEIGAAIGVIDRGIELSKAITSLMTELRNIITGINVLVLLDLGGPALPGIFSFITRILQYIGMEVVNKDIPRHYVWGSSIVDSARRLAIESDAIVVEVPSVEVSIERVLDLISSLDIDPVKPLIVVPVLGLSDFGPQIVWKVRVVAEAVQKAVASRSRVVLRVEDMRRKPIFSMM